MSDDVVSLLDVIKSDSQDQLTARALLGGCDDTKCSYSETYLTRQPIYSCLTCTSNQLAGVCLACSYHCHIGHELIELYTKRNFRCDCGNLKFPTNPCKLESNKDPENSRNDYNHNFQGKYCTCESTYDANESCLMVQCIICEDWYHTQHLVWQETVSDFEDGQELVCQLCAEKHRFLYFYKENSGCPSETSTGKGAIVLPGEWRAGLCTCVRCKDMLRDQKVEFLLNEEDSCREYEKKGLSIDSTTSDHWIRDLNLSQQHVLSGGMRYLMDEFNSFVADFAESGDVVTEDDVHDFFERLRTKRQRMV